MKSTIKNLLIKKIEAAFDESYKAVNSIIIDFNKERKTPLRILDIGSGTGEVTRKYVAGLEKYDIYGLDVIEPDKFREINYTFCNLEGATYPFESELFDIVIAGQTIEHLLNKDLLIEEAYRVLKPGGLFICATENIASFDNILSLIIGQEPLSQNTGYNYNTTSILSPNFMHKMGPNGNKYLHKNVTSYYGLQRLFKVNGFKEVKIRSFGNVTKILEYFFPIYNRIVVVYSLKD